MYTTTCAPGHAVQTIHSLTWLRQFNSPDIKPFPYDLKFGWQSLVGCTRHPLIPSMTVWGDPARKTFDDTKLLDITSGYNCGNPASGKATYGTYSLPKERCEVLTMKGTFVPKSAWLVCVHLLMMHIPVLLPSCTSGKFDQANPSAHMAFTTCVHIVGIQLQPDVHCRVQRRLGRTEVPRHPPDPYPIHRYRDFPLDDTPRDRTRRRATVRSGQRRYNGLRTSRRLHQRMG